MAFICVTSLKGMPFRNGVKYLNGNNLCVNRYILSMLMQNLVNLSKVAYTRVTYKQTQHTALLWKAEQSSSFTCLYPNIIVIYYRKNRRVSNENSCLDLI